MFVVSEKTLNNSLLKNYKNILILFLIVFLFLSPFWVADWLYYQEKHLITHTTNHGTLIIPPIDLSHLLLKDLHGATLHSDPFKGQWTLLAIAPTANPDSFRKLYEMRQIRLMLGKNRNKLQRMLLFYRAKMPVILSSQLTALYTGSSFTVIDEKKWLALFTSSQLKQNFLILDGFFIIDPQGRLMMSYQPDANPKNIMQDLRRLIETNT